jgi:iron complex outermembrane receptor protein
VAGLYYFDDDIKRQASSIRFAGSSGNVIRDNMFVQSVRTKSIALYSDIEWSISDVLSLSLGGRFTYEDKKAQVDFDNALRQDLNFQSPTFQQDWSEFTPRIALNWKPNQKLSVYGSFTEGFTSGGFNTEEDTVDVIGRAFDPEFIKAFEFGIKADVSSKFRVNVTAFNQKYADKQEGFLDPNFNFIIVNAAKAKMNGAEFEMRWTANDYFAVNASYAYLDAKYDKFEIPLRNDEIEDRSGNFLPTSPKNSFNIGLDFFFYPSEGLVDGNITYSWQNDYFTGSENRDTFLIDSNELLNAHISYQTDDDWRFTLWAKNLTDKEYVLIRSDFGSIIGVGEHFGAPRTFGLKISKIFE